MQQVSELYEEIYRSRQYYVETSIVIGGKGFLITENADRILFGGTAIIVSGGGPDGGFGESRIISLKTTRRVFKNNIPEVGCCPSGEIYLEMIQPAGEIDRQAEITPFVRLVSKIDGRKSEWIQKCSFFTDTRDNTHNDDDLDILSLHGYDAMMKAEREYGEFFSPITFLIQTNAEDETSDWTKSNGVYTATVYDSSITPEKEVFVEYTDADSLRFSSCVTYEQVSGGVRFRATQSPPPNFFGAIITHARNTLGFPAVDIDVINDIASKMEVEVDPRSIPYINQRYEIQYPAEYTMRETLGYIGAMYGGNWIINDFGQLQFLPLWDLPEETSLLIDDLGYRITFGGDRIKISGR